MLGFHLIDNVNPPFAADYLIIGANFLYAGTHFHADLLLSERHSAYTTNNC